MGGYVMNVFVDRFNKSDCIRFVYKVKRGEGVPSKDIQLAHFWKECVKLSRDRNAYCHDFYVFKIQKHISIFGLFIRNVFLPKYNKIIVIPSWGCSGKYEENKDFFYYTFKPGDNWWSVAKKICHDGHKVHELLKYNNMRMNEVKPRLTIKIPYALIKADSKAILQEE